MTVGACQYRLDVHCEKLSMMVLTRVSSKSAQTGTVSWYRLLLSVLLFRCGSIQASVRYMRLNFPERAVTVGHSGPKQVSATHAPHGMVNRYACTPDVHHRVCRPRSSAGQRCRPLGDRGVSDESILGDFSAMASRSCCIQTCD
jgi:hypothetical protein